MRARRARSRGGRRRSPPRQRAWSTDIVRPLSRGRPARRPRLCRCSRPRACSRRGVSSDGIRFAWHRRASTRTDPRRARQPWQPKAAASLPRPARWCGGGGSGPIVRPRRACQPGARSRRPRPRRLQPRHRAPRPRRRRCGGARASRARDAVIRVSAAVRDVTAARDLAAARDSAPDWPRASRCRAGRTLF